MRSCSCTSRATCTRLCIDADNFMRYKDRDGHERRRMPETGQPTTARSYTPARRRRGALRRGPVCRRIGEPLGGHRTGIARAFPASGEASTPPLPQCLRFRHHQHRRYLHDTRRWGRLWHRGERHMRGSSMLRATVYGCASLLVDLGAAISRALWLGSVATTPVRRLAAPRTRNGRRALRAPRHYRPTRTRSLMARRGRR